MKGAGMSVAPALADLKVGDTAMLTADRGSAFPVAVVKAGPVWLTVSTGRREWRIRRDNGRPTNDGDKLYSWSPYLCTLEEYEQDKARKKIMYELQRQGITVQASSRWRGHEGQLAALLSSTTLWTEDQA